MSYFPKINLSTLWPFRQHDDKTRPKRRPTSSNRRHKSGAFGIAINPWESKLVSLQSILIWERPGNSALFVSIVNIIYWLVALIDVRLLSTISMLSLVYFLHNQWVYTIWPEIRVPEVESVDVEDWTPVNPSVLSAPELSRYIENSWTYVKKKCAKLLLLRRREPGKFCILMFLFFSVAFLIGYFISGVWLFYIIMMGVMCLPGFFIHIVPKSLFVQLKSITSFIFSSGGKKIDHEKELSEFLPEETDDAQTLLGIPLSPNDPPLPKIKAGKKGKKKRKVTSANESNSFLTGLTAEEFPSIVDDEVSESELELPQIERTPTPEVVRNEDKGHDIHFVPTHFGDSSEDEEFEVGLTFNVGKEVTAGAIRPVGQQQSMMQTTAFNQVSQIVSTVMSDLVTSVMGSGAIEPIMDSDRVDGIKEERRGLLDSGSSTDDFEMISDNDLQ